MEFSAAQIAKLLGGEVAGNPDVKVSGLSKIEEGAPGTLSFLANPKYNHYLYTTDASIVIVNRSLELERPVKETCTLIRVENAYTSFATLLNFYNSQKVSRKGIEQPSFIHASAKHGEDCYIGAFAYIGENVRIGKNVSIYPHVYIGDGVTVGDNTTLYSGVRIYHDCSVGNNCTVHSNTVIGADGFGFAPGSENYTKVPQIGNVIIEDNVEIGACTCIDRATMGSTIIRKGAKLDNLIQVAHNAEVGEHSVIAGQSGVAGSSKVGKNCMVGAQVGITGHIRIADGTKIAGQSGVGGTIREENTIIQGSPAFGINEYRRSYVLFKNLPNLADRVRALENQLKTGGNHNQ